MIFTCQKWQAGPPWLFSFVYITQAHNWPQTQRKLVVGWLPNPLWVTQKEGKIDQFRIAEFSVWLSFERDTDRYQNRPSSRSEHTQTLDFLQISAQAA